MPKRNSEVCPHLLPMCGIWNSNAFHFYCSCHFVSKINLASLKKFKFVSTFSQFHEIKGVLFTLTILVEQESSTGEDVFLSGSSISFVIAHDIRLWSALILGRLENFEVVYFVGAELFWNFRGVVGCIS